MDYHAKNRIKDGVLWIPINGSVFKKRKEIWPNLKDEPHNIRLSLVASGVNPFGELRYTYLVSNAFVIKKQ